MVKEIAYFAYPVTDVLRARRFYEEVLGLTIGQNWENQWVEYDIGGVTLAIAKFGPEMQAGAQGGHVALEVEDLTAVLAKLRSAGAQIKMEPFEGSVCTSAVVLDPDGNPIVIHKRKPVKLV